MGTGARQPRTTAADAFLTLPGRLTYYSGAAKTPYVIES